jgi:SecD/SecF fusion protein
MQRNYLRGLLICLIPCLLAGLFVVRLDRYKLGIDLAGGTILVYEINLERTKQRRESLGETTPSGGTRRSSASNTVDTDAGLSPSDMNQLAAQIKHRIDPTDIKNVTVRPLGGKRVEIIIPFAGAASGRANLTAEDVEEVKRLISQMGVLEFRILANGTDDLEGINAARQAVDSKTAAELEARAAAGLAPEGPEGEFSVDIGESKAKVRYVWVELSQEERDSLFLTNADEKPSEERLKERAKKSAGDLWHELLPGRLGGKTVLLDARHNVTTDVPSAYMVLFSRISQSREQRDIEGKAKQKYMAAGKTPEEADALVDHKKVEYFVLTRVSSEDSLRVGGDITMTATAGQDRAFNLAIDFRFNGAGAQQFGKMTRRNKPTGNKETGFKRSLAILLDDRIVSVASINDEITSQGQITGNFTKDYVDRIVQILRSGALSAELREKPVSENTIGPTLGRDTIQKGTMAVGVAFVAVLIFMVVYYRFAGIVACIALFANLLLTVGFMVAVHAAFTLSGLAGLVLTLGMAVDANVLIYERLREERNKGANIVTAIRNGYERAFPTIIDTHLTSIFTAIVLYTFGNDNLKGFAITLTVGLAISLFTSLYMTRLMFDYWQHKKLLTDLSMMRLFGKLGFHPMKYRHFFFALTGISSILGLALFVYRGEAGLNVDFRGGTVFSGRLKDGQERALNTVGDKPGFRDLLSEDNQRKRLNAISARWENQPPKAEGQLTPEEIALVGTYIYTITYDDKTSATVTLSHKPAGNTPEEMEQDLISTSPTRPGRARHLPDVSVEQTFRLGETFPEGKSRDFTIRTTERQPDLVRVSLDRLFRASDDRSIIDGTTITNTDIKGPLVELTFSRPTSKNFMQELLDREFRKIGALVEGESFKLTGDEKTLKDGRYEKMTLDVSKNPTFNKLVAQPPVPDNDPEKLKQKEALAKIVAETQRAFDASPEPERLEVFDSTLASETRNKAFYAIVASWVAILLYLWFRFGNWTFGAAAVICLIHDLCFTLGAIAVCHYLFAVPALSFLGLEDFKIDLAAVAALLTLVGYSVSDTIVVFDRIREVRGKNPKLTAEMIDDSVNQTLSRTILTATTVFLVSIVLYVFGGEGVHLFAFVMVMGVLVGTYSSIFVAAPLLLIFGEGHERAAITTSEEPTEKEEAEEEVLEG